MFKPVLRGLCVIAAAAAWLPAAAEVTLSTSNNPTVALDERLSSLFGAERRTMSSLGQKNLTRLIEAPEPKASGGRRDIISPEVIEAMPVAKGGDQWSCLSQALYFEARGESLKGIVGVAEVILNRVDDPRFPSTVCGVINQGTGERYRCQFTYTCDGQPEVIGEKRAYNLVGKVARVMLDGAPRKLTAGATFYHTKSVQPKWSQSFERTATIGCHHFYREPDRMAGG